MCTVLHIGMPPAGWCSRPITTGYRTASTSMMLTTQLMLLAVLAGAPLAWGHWSLDGQHEGRLMLHSAGSRRHLQQAPYVCGTTPWGAFAEGSGGAVLNVPLNTTNVCYTASLTATVMDVYVNRRNASRVSLTAKYTGTMVLDLDHVICRTFMWSAPSTQDMARALQDHLRGVGPKPYDNPTIDASDACWDADPVTCAYNQGGCSEYRVYSVCPATCPAACSRVWVLATTSVTSITWQPGACCQRSNCSAAASQFVSGVASPSSPSTAPGGRKSKAGPIAGGVIGAVLAAVLITGLLLCWAKRRSWPNTATSTTQMGTVTVKLAGPATSQANAAPLPGLPAPHPASYLARPSAAVKQPELAASPLAARVWAVPGSVALPPVPMAVGKQQLDPDSSVTMSTTLPTMAPSGDNSSSGGSGAACLLPPLHALPPFTVLALGPLAGHDPLPVIRQLQQLQQQQQVRQARGTPEPSARASRPGSSSEVQVPAAAGQPAALKPEKAPTPAPQLVVTHSDSDRVSAALASLRVSWADITMQGLLGEGGFGQVYKGSWQGNRVAVKVLSPERAKANVLKELHAEALIMSELRHPCIARVFGLVDEAPHHAIVMAYYRRGTLTGFMQTSAYQDLSVRAKLRMALQVASGMRFLHEKKPLPILHGDLKTSNLLLEDDGRVVIADFGLASTMSSAAAATPGAHSGALTLSISPPEVLNDPHAPRTASADVYAFAVVLLEILTGAPPFRGLKASELKQVVGLGKRPPIPELLPPQVTALINDCWAQDPAARPSFVAITERLAAIIQDLEPEPLDDAEYTLMHPDDTMRVI